MGTWGTGAFDDDGAMDWVAELEGSSDGGAVREALRVVADAPTGDYLEAPEGQIALAAAEIVAAAAGTGGPVLPDEVRTWVEKHGALVAAHAELALRAVDRVLARENSELRDLWSEEDGADPESIAAWEQKVADLRRRLQSLV